MIEQSHLYTIEHQHIGVESIHRLSLKEKTLAILADQDLLQIVHWQKNSAANVVYSRHLEWMPDSIDLSPSQRYLLLRSSGSKHLVVWDWQADHVLAEFGSVGASQAAAAALTASQGQDLLLVSHQRMILEAYWLHDMSRLFRVDYETPLAFIFTHLYPLLEDGDTFCAIGYLFGESKDSLYSFSLRDLVADRPPAGRFMMKGQKPIRDYAYRLAAGPGGTEHVTIFRDPEDDEVPDEDEAEEGQSVDPLADITNFRGLYTRRLSDGQIVERVDIDIPVKNGQNLFRTENAIIVECGDAIAMIPRQSHPQATTQPDLIPARAVALDAKERSFAILTTDGNVKIFQS